jgi:threonine/homoserine/homoserine lactone efflux protein
MTPLQCFVAFAIAAGLLTITPGVDTVMVLRTATVEGARRAALAAVGIGLGCLVWGLGIALGLGALIAASPWLFMVVRWGGAAYLAWIGIGLLLHPRHGLDLDASADAATGQGATLWLRRGLITNLLNPKIGIFYISFLPQFVPAGYPMTVTVFLLACAHVAMGLFWFGIVIGATAPLRVVLTSSSVMRSMDRVTGGLFVALAAKLAIPR